MNQAASIRGLFFTTLLALATPAAAQTGVTAVAGLSLANFHGSDIDIPGLSRGNRTGVALGAFLDFPLGGIIGARPGLLYAEKGARFTDPSTGDKAGFNLDYLEIPALLVVAVPTSGSLSPEFFGGPTFAFRIKCAITFSASGGPSGSADCPSGSGINSTDFTLLVGAGVRFKSFVAQLAFDFGLSSLDETSDDIKNQAFYALVGWMFKLN